MFNLKKLHLDLPITDEQWSFEISRFFRALRMCTATFFCGVTLTLLTHNHGYGQTSDRERITALESNSKNEVLVVTRLEDQVEHLQSQVNTIEGFGAGISIILTLLTALAPLFRRSA